MQESESQLATVRQSNEELREIRARGKEENSLLKSENDSLCAYISELECRLQDKQQQQRPRAPPPQPLSPPSPSSFDSRCNSDNMSNSNSNGNHRLCSSSSLLETPSDSGSTSMAIPMPVLMPLMPLMQENMSEFEPMQWCSECQMEYSLSKWKHKRTSRIRYRLKCPNPRCSFQVCRQCRQEWQLHRHLQCSDVSMILNDPKHWMKCGGCHGLVKNSSGNGNSNSNNYQRLQQCQRSTCYKFVCFSCSGLFRSEIAGLQHICHQKK